MQTRFPSSTTTATASSTPLQKPRTPSGPADVAAILALANEHATRQSTLGHGSDRRSGFPALPLSNRSAGISSRLGNFVGGGDDEDDDLDGLLIQSTQSIIPTAGNRSSSVPASLTGLTPSRFPRRTSAAAFGQRGAFASPNVNGTTNMTSLNANRASANANAAATRGPDGSGRVGSVEGNGHGNGNGNGVGVGAGAIQSGVGNGNMIASGVHGASHMAFQSYSQLTMRQRLENMPLWLFYRFLWRKDRPLLIMTFGLNYVLPIVLEMLPWYFSKRKLNNELRRTRIEIQHNMVTGKQFSSTSIIQFVLYTVLHTFIDTVLRQLNNKVAVANRFAIRRLLIEKILYSEIGAFDRIRTDDLEMRLSSDITQTMTLVNSTIPTTLGCIYAITREGSDLFKNRAQVDLLAVLRPTILGLAERFLGWIKFNYFEKKQDRVARVTQSNMSRFITNTIEGLCEIQINNLQKPQLQQLEQMIDDEMETYGWESLVTRTWNSISNRSIIGFVSEVYVVHHVMEKRGINHEQYRKIQNDVDHVLNLVGRALRQIRFAFTILGQQARVVAMMTLPSFQNESEMLQTNLFPFKTLRIANVKFRYSDHLPLALDFQEELLILPGRRYALVGQNRSGKSTLAHILCKLYQPEQGDLSVNGVQYPTISRIALRSLIAYVSQRPFIFPGTIRENILIGNPNATDDEVIEAASNAGIFAFAASTGQSNKPVIKPYVQTEVKRQAPGLNGRHSAFYCNDHIDFSFLDSTILPPSQHQPHALSVNKCLVCTKIAGLDIESSATAVYPSDEGWKGSRESSVKSDMAHLTPANIKAILDMHVAARGGNISGGFAQSVALARIFLRKDSQIVILDEATSQMDPFKKREIIMPRLFDFVKRRNIALIMISHDFTIMPEFDEIFVMEQGKLVHKGSHKQLMEQKAPLYVRMIGTTL